MASWNEWVTGANMTLSEVLSSLNSARVGLDVKDKLYWSFYKIVELAIKEGNANFDVAKAAGAFKDLASRLDASDQKVNSNTAQLVQKVDKGNVSVSDINKNLGKLDQTFMTEEFLQQMAGTTPINAVPADESVTTQKIVEKAVTPEKASFFVESRNKFNKYEAKKGFVMNISDGTVTPNISALYTFTMPAVAGETYTVTKGLGSAAYGHGFFNASGSLLYSVASGPDNQSLKAPPGTSYAIFTGATAYIDNQQIEIGVSPSEYTPHKVLNPDIVNLNKKSVDSEHLKNVVIEGNDIYNDKTLVSGKYVNLFGDTVTLEGTSYAEIPVPSGANKLSIYRPSQVYSSQTGAVSFRNDSGDKIGFHVFSQADVSVGGRYVTIDLPAGVSSVFITTKAGFGDDEVGMMVSTDDFITPRRLKSLFDASVGDDVQKSWLYNKFGVSFGDSITWYDGRPFGASHSEAGQIAVGYQSYMREMLECSVDNKGVSGQDMLSISNIIKNYTNYANTDFVTITSGANDERKGVPVGELQEIGSDFVLTTFTGALQSAIEHVINANKKIKIYLMTPIRGWYNEYGTADVPNTDPSVVGMMSEKYADAIKAVGKLYGIPVLDWYSDTRLNELNKNDFMGDGLSIPYYLHPTNEFYERMASPLIPFLNNN